MADAQEIFDTEWDPFPEPKLEFAASQSPEALVESLRWELDAACDLDSLLNQLPPAACRAQALTLWFASQDFSHHQSHMQQIVERVLSEAPHSTLQIILEPREPTSPSSGLFAAAAIDTALGEHRAGISEENISQLLASCYRHPNYLDRYYSLNPHGLLGSKRVLIKRGDEALSSDEWFEQCNEEKK